MNPRSLLSTMGRLCVRAAFPASPCLPTRLGGRWVQLPRVMWPGLRWTYEPYMARAISEVLKTGDLFFDLGAHHGVWSAYAAKVVGPSGRVVACEPAPQNFTILKLQNVTALQVGVGKQAGLVSFYAQGCALSGSFVHSVTEINQRQNRDPISKHVIPVRTIDSLTDEFGAPAAIKLDVEGFEHEALRGAQQTLAIPGIVWLIEIHPPQLALSGSSETLFLDDLRKAGLSWSILDKNENGLYTIAAKR